MEIIKRGTLPSEREFFCTCHICKTEYKFKQAEGKVTYDQRDGNLISVTCPVCSHNNNVSL